MLAFVEHKVLWNIVNRHHSGASACVASSHGSGLALAVTACVRRGLPLPRFLGSFAFLRAASVFLNDLANPPNRPNTTAA